MTAQNGLQQIRHVTNQILDLVGEDLIEDHASEEILLDGCKFALLMLTLASSSSLSNSVHASLHDRHQVTSEMMASLPDRLAALHLHYGFPYGALLEALSPPGQPNMVEGHQQQVQEVVLWMNAYASRAYPQKSMKMVTIGDDGKCVKVGDN